MRNVLLVAPLIVYSHLTAQVDSIRTLTHAFWSAEDTIQMVDFRKTTADRRFIERCDSLSLCWGACVGLWTVIDEPKKKRKRGKLLERTYFTPAFEFAESFQLADDSLGYLTQLLIFDAYELGARRCRMDIEQYYNQMPYYGTISIVFKKVEAENMIMVQGMINNIIQAVYVDRDENAYPSWRNTIDELLADTEGYSTSDQDRLRFITLEPLSDDYRKAKTVIIHN